MVKKDLRPLIHLRHPRDDFGRRAPCRPWDQEPGLVTKDPKLVTCKECLRIMGKSSLSFLRCLEIVVELANENVLEERRARENELEEARQEQLDAVERVWTLLDLLKGD